jgi:hypothetical protein
MYNWACAAHKCTCVRIFVSYESTRARIFVSYEMGQNDKILILVRQSYLCLPVYMLGLGFTAYSIADA